MGLNKYDAVASGILTATIWDNQMNDIGSEFEVAYGIQTGSDVYIYDTSNNLVSGNHFSVTGSWYEWYDFSASNTLLSGHKLKDGKQTDYAYYYDSNNRLSGTQSRVI
jgi:hypothetical protein